MQLSSWNRRKRIRRRCKVQTRLYIGSRPAVPCVIEDLTPDGARISSEERIRASTRMLIFLPSTGELWPAEVRWRREQTFGIQFIDREAAFTCMEAIKCDAPRAVQAREKEFSGAVSSILRPPKPETSRES